jgi:FMN phosphatase YigB (HAD superfamily)
LALERLGASAEETLFVGDDYRLDIVGARAAGITPVLIDRNARFLETDCLKIRRMDELLEIVSGASSSEPTSRVCISGYSL